MDVFKTVLKVNIRLGYFCKKFVTKNFQKLHNMITLSLGHKTNEEDDLSR